MDDSYKEDWDMGSQDGDLGGRRGRGPEAQAVGEQPQRWVQA